MTKTCAQIAKMYQTDPQGATKLLKTVPIYDEVASKHILWGKVVHRCKMEYYVFIPSMCVIGSDHRPLKVFARMCPLTRPKSYCYIGKRNEVQKKVREGYKIKGVHIEDTCGAYRVRLPYQLLHILEKRVWSMLHENISALKDAREAVATE